jgi:hypothetical protein
MAAGQDAAPEAYRRVDKLQTYMSKSLPVQELVNLLTGFKRKGTASWWSCFDVITTEAVDREAGEQYRCVKLQCNHCKAVLSANNPSKTSSQHLKRDGTHIPTTDNSGNTECSERQWSFEYQQLHHIFVLH